MRSSDLLTVLGAVVVLVLLAILLIADDTKSVVTYLAVGAGAVICVGLILRVFRNEGGRGERR